MGELPEYTGVVFGSIGAETPNQSVAAGAANAHGADNIAAGATARDKNTDKKTRFTQALLFNPLLPQLPRQGTPMHAEPSRGLGNVESRLSQGLVDPLPLQGLDGGRPLGQFHFRVARFP